MGEGMNKIISITSHNKELFGLDINGNLFIVEEVNPGSDGIEAFYTWRKVTRFEYKEFRGELVR